MPTILRRPDGWIPERLVTPESVYWNRREFLRRLGLGLGVSAGLMGGVGVGSAWGANGEVILKSLPAKRNPSFDPAWKMTSETAATSYNNFYEFSLDKQEVRHLTGRFVTNPWPIEIKGLVEKPMTVDVEELVSEFSVEERVYRFRCVEAWAMIVPWTGFQLSKLIEKVKPTSEAKYVRFETANRPDQFPGMAKLKRYPWPYFEGLRMDEAMHPLTFMATGLYGKPMPKQNGAPVRLVVPWKYGYKSIKSVVKIEFVKEQPKTFWETLSPDEYPFESNVNPKVPHPRWSQATERMIDTGDRVRTQMFNGYAEQVAKMYGAVTG